MEMVIFLIVALVAVAFAIGLAGLMQKHVGNSQSIDDATKDEEVMLI